VVKITSEEKIKKKKEFEHKVLGLLNEEQKKRLLKHKKELCESSKYLSELTILYYILTGKFKEYGFDKSNLKEIFPDKKDQKNPDFLMEKDNTIYEFEVYQPDEAENKISKNNAFYKKNEHTLSGIYPDSNINALRNMLEQKRKQLSEFKNPVLFIDAGKSLSVFAHLLNGNVMMPSLQKEHLKSIKEMLKEIGLGNLKGIISFNYWDYLTKNKDELICIYWNFN